MYGEEVGMPVNGCRNATFRYEAGRLNGVLNAIDNRRRHLHAQDSVHVKAFRTTGRRLTGHRTGRDAT